MTKAPNGGMDESTVAPAGPAGPLPFVGRCAEIVGRDMAGGAGIAWRYVTGAGRATGTAVRRAAVGTGEVVSDGGVAAVRGARAGAAWTIVQWRMERNDRRDRDEAERTGVDEASVSVANKTKEPSHLARKRSARPPAPSS